jgi:hypothetical protein
LATTPLSLIDNLIGRVLAKPVKYRARVNYHIAIRIL